MLADGVQIKELRMLEDHSGCQCSKAKCSKMIINRVKGEKEVIERDRTKLESICEEEGKEEVRANVCIARENFRENVQETATGLLSQTKAKHSTKAYIDSGASTHMFNSQNMFQSINEEKKVQLITACERGNKACVGELKRLSQNERCLVEKGSSAVFSAGLVENLVSVGKLCDEGKAIVFDRESVKVYKGEVSVKGEKVLEEKREVSTGLYPVNVSTNGVANKEWEWSESSSKDTRKVEFKGFLARFYVKEGIGEYERWHNKLGHIGRNKLECVI